MSVGGWSRKVDWREEVWTIDSNIVIIVTVVAGWHEAATPIKQHKSRDADWLKNISSSKRSELLECELKKMTTVIVSECTALWKEMKSRWKRKLHRRLNRKNSPSPAEQLNSPSLTPHVIQFHKTQREKQLPPDRLQAMSYRDWDREVVVIPWSGSQQRAVALCSTPNGENLHIFSPGMCHKQRRRAFYFLYKKKKENKPCVLLCTKSWKFVVGTRIYLVTNTDGNQLEFSYKQIVHRW